jgi:hypothetical protein
MNNNYGHVVQAASENHVINGSMASLPPLTTAGNVLTTSAAQSLTLATGSSSAAARQLGRATNVDRLQRSSTVGGNCNVERHSSTGSGTPSPASTPSSGECASYKVRSVATIGASSVSGATCSPPMTADGTTVLGDGELKAEIM